MGLFSFFKNAGEKLFGSKEETPATVAPEVAAALNQQKVVLLQGALMAQGLNIQDLSIELNNDQVTVYGTASSQTDKEKAVLVLGNVTGIASVDDRMTVEVPEEESKFYEVQKGDSLSKIAGAFYGDVMKYPVIFEANKPMLSHPDKIYPGQVLRIPSLQN